MVCKQVVSEVEGEACMLASWLGLAGRFAWEAEVGIEPVPGQEAAGRCGWEGGRHRLYEELEAAADRQASRWAVEELACYRFALVAACIEASACTLALEAHRLALVGHRKAFLVREDYKLAWWEGEACKQVLWEEEACRPALWEVEVCRLALQEPVACRKVQVELCRLASLEGVCIQALLLLHKLALEGSQTLDEEPGVQVHTQACLALACIVEELLAEGRSWVSEPEERSWVLGLERS